MIFDWLAGGLAVGTTIAGAITSIAGKGKVGKGEALASHAEELAKCAYCKRAAVGYDTGRNRYVCAEHMPDQQQQRPAPKKVQQVQHQPVQARRAPVRQYDEDEWEEDDYYEDEYEDEDLCQHGFEIGRCKACYETEKRRRAIAAAQQTYVVEQSQTVQRRQRPLQSQGVRQLGGRRGQVPIRSQIPTQRQVQRLPPAPRQRRRGM